MVQYKVMEKEKEKFIFRLPNTQFTDEISRMDSILQSLSAFQNNGSIVDFRINNNPFFIKICPRIVFEPDDVGLSSGMYLPLDYLKILQLDKSIAGSKGGLGISFDNVGRYFDNTAFKTIIEGGWIGTNISQSILLEQIIRNILVNGRTAVVAIKKNLEEKKPLIQETAEEDMLF